MRIFLVGITCSSHDVMLSVFLLKSAVLASGLDAEVKIGHYIHILEYEFEDRCQQIADEIIAARPDVLGMSVYTWNLKACERIVDLVKQAILVTVVFGGPEMSNKYSNPNVDKVIVGEGEQALVTFLGGPELERIPSPYLSGYIPDELLQREGFKAVVETQRGCSFRCAYCQYHRNFPAIKYLSFNRAVKEIKYAYDHGASGVRIADGNFLSDWVRATEIILTLKWLGVKIPLYLECIPSFVNASFADALKNYGAHVTVGMGQQSINPKTLKLIKRGGSVHSLRRAYILLNYAGATVSTDLILGLPLETRESFIDALDFVIQETREGKHIIHVSDLLVLPDTEMEQLIKQYPPAMTEDDKMYCARMVAAAYRVLNSDMREWFYNSGGSIELLDKIAGLTEPTTDLEAYWNFHVFKEITKEELWQLTPQVSLT